MDSMTIASAPTPAAPSVFDATLPTLDYDDVRDPARAHQLIAQARARSPIVIGTHGPEVLSYQLVRSVLRDPRFRVPQGMFLSSQGITSGPLWDRVAANLISLDGEEHQRLRKLVVKAFTPRGTPALRAAAMVVLSLLASLASPVAGLFLLVLAAALFLTGRRRAGVCVAVGLPVVVGTTSLLFPFSGVQPISLDAIVLPAVTSVAAILFCAPKSWRFVRTGAAVYLAGILLTWLVPSPIGSNVERLSPLSRREALKHLQ